MVRDIYGAVFNGGSAILMGRVVYADGTLVLPDEITSVTYGIEQLSGCSGSATAVPGHSDVAIPAAVVLVDTLQTDDAWSEDAIGYNFRHEIDISVAAAFPLGNRTYLVRYALTPATGQPIIFRFLLEAI